MERTEKGSVRERKCQCAATGKGAARNPRGSPTLPGSLLGPGWGLGPRTPPPPTAGRAQRCVLRAWLCTGSLEGSGIWGSPLGLGVLQLGAAPCPQRLPDELGPPRHHFKGDLQILHLPLQKGSPCPLPPQHWGFGGSLLPRVCPGLSTEHAGCPAGPQRGKRPRGARPPRLSLLSPLPAR